MRIIGIDPGKNGGVVTITRDRGILDMRVMPDHPSGLIELISNAKAERGNIHVFVEKAQAMPKNGSVSMFNYGVGYGIIQGILHALQIPHTMVLPATWTRVMHHGASKGDPKARSLEIAHRLFPGQSFVNPESERARKPHDGIVDALLIAEYGRRLISV